MVESLSYPLTIILDLAPLKKEGECGFRYRVAKLVEAELAQWRPFPEHPIYKSRVHTTIDMSTYKATCTIYQHELPQHLR